MHHLVRCDVAPGTTQNRTRLRRSPAGPRDGRWFDVAQERADGVTSLRAGAPGRGQRLSPPVRADTQLRDGKEVEVTTGFEPVNAGFADQCVKPLRHVTPCGEDATSLASVAAPRGFEPRFSDPKSGVLPLDEGASTHADSLRGEEEGSGAEDGTRTRDPHLGKVMLYQLSHFRPIATGVFRWCREPDSNWRPHDFQSCALPTELSRPAGAVRTLHHILGAAHKRPQGRPRPHGCIAESSPPSGPR